MLHLAFVSVQNSSTILVVDGCTLTIAAQFSVQQPAGTLAFNPATRRLYIDNFGTFTMVQFLKQ